MKIDRRMLGEMHNFALTEYKDKAKNPHESSEQFLARCWCEAFINIIKGEGYDVTAIANNVNSTWPDGVEGISVTKDRV